MTKTLAAFSGALLADGTISAAGWAHTQNNGTNHSRAIGEPPRAALVVDPNGDRVAFEPGSGQLVADWNRELLKIEQTPGAQPASVHPTRSYALLQTAEYDAVVSITEADDPYAFSVVAPRGARPDAAADQAAHDVLRALFPSFAPQLDSMLASELGSVPDGPGRAFGLTVGARAATILLALRANDGSATPQPPFVPGSQPGDYQITPPNNAPAVFTGWGNVTPWALDAGDQFRPPPPPPLSSSQWATAINQVQSVGQDTSTTRTPDQTTIAGSGPRRFGIPGTRLPTIRSWITAPTWRTPLMSCRF